MGMTSAAEARLDSRIRPEIAVMQSRTSYPKRRLTVAGDVGGGADDPVTEALRLANSASMRSAGVPVRALLPATANAGGAGGKGPSSGPAAVKRRRDVAAGSLRLTRRGRIAIGAAVALAVLTAAGLLWLAIASQARAASDGASVRPATAVGTLTRVVVRPGQTLYSIALAADPSADPRVIIREIVDQNSLTSTRIQVGQVIWVPRG